MARWWARSEIPNITSDPGRLQPGHVHPGIDPSRADQQPPATIVHLSWNAMVGIGTALVLPGPVGAGHPVAAARLHEALAGSCARPRSPDSLRVVALEAGWIVTEVGRQPWVVYQILRTADAVTHAPGVQTTFIAVVALYAGLWAWRRCSCCEGSGDAGPRGRGQAGGRALPDDTDEAVPYGPRQRPDGPRS